MRAYDGAYMKRAFAAALKGAGKVHPNPRVGAVVLSGDGTAAWTGYHRCFGKDHAEVDALQQAGKAARGGILYVTLEPCSTQGKTPPCCEAIVKSGIAQVFSAIDDIDQANGAKAGAFLRNHFIEYTGNCDWERAYEINEPYFKFRSTGMPLVTVKLASSLDGRIAAADGTSRWITGKASRSFVHRLRKRCDAVMVGSGTVLRDDPELISREKGGYGPVKLVLDSRLDIPETARIFNGPYASWTIVAAVEGCDRSKKRLLEKQGVRVLELQDDGRGRVNLEVLLSHVASRGIIDIVCEGGGVLATELLDRGLVDRLILFYAPKLIGTSGHSFYLTPGDNTLRELRGMTLEKIRRFGDDICAVYTKDIIYHPLCKE